MDALDLKLFNKVVEVYKKNNSIQETSKQMEISRSKVRKILITMKELKCPLTELALPLLKQGKSQQEVANILNVSFATLSTYLPYENRICNKEQKSSVAIRCENYRARQVVAANKQIVKIEQTETKKGNEKMKNTKGIILKLELETKYADMDILKKYGKVKDGIIRNFVVPVDMPLHNLHFAIQKAFGWQNSHLHHFEFDEEVFKELTNYNFGKWSDYCGVYFRFPSEDFEDWYWDDDYQTGESFKSWLKRKYNRPYEYHGYQENYEYSREMINNFPKTIIVGPTFEEYRSGAYYQNEIPSKDAHIDQIEQSFEALLREILEKLTIEEVLKAGKNKGLIYKYDYGDGWTISINQIGTMDDVNNVYCIYADGLNVMDDVGGVGGYCEFLKEINDSEDEDNANDYLQWARYLGWTGRRSKPENIL